MAESPGQKPQGSNGPGNFSDDGSSADQQALEAGAAGAGDMAASDGTGSGVDDNSTGETPQEYAASFGYALSFFNSNPELKDLLNRAMAGNFDTARFTAELQGTKWFRQHSASYRQYYLESKADPASAAASVNQARASLATMARQMGASLSAKQLNLLALDTVRFGYNSDQQQNQLGEYIKANGNGIWQGNAASQYDSINSVLQQYGVNVSATTMNKWVRSAVLGGNGEDVAKQYALNAAKSRYPGLAGQLDSGMTIQQIADPYKQSYAQILEVNPDAVKLNDPLIQKALTASDDKGKPSPQSIWSFEQTLRQDPRYLKTDGAQDATMSVAHQVLNDFGLTY